MAGREGGSTLTKLPYVSSRRDRLSHLLESNFPLLPKALRFLNGFTHRKGNMIIANMPANSGKDGEIDLQLVSS